MKNGYINAMVRFKKGLFFGGFIKISKPLKGYFEYILYGKIK
tara:strand:+ start:606 stop:731 length:126 start_codon:yes stop_codon:yes gene_type:complete